MVDPQEQRKQLIKLLIQTQAVLLQKRRVLMIVVKKKIAARATIAQVRLLILIARPVLRKIVCPRRLQAVVSTPAVVLQLLRQPIVQVQLRLRLAQRVRQLQKRLAHQVARRQRLKMIRVTKREE